MKTHIATVLTLVAIALPALAGDSEDALRKQLAAIEKQITDLRASQKALYEKRSAVFKQLHAAKLASITKQRSEIQKRRDASDKKAGSAKKPTKPTQKKPSVKKPTKPTQKKPSVKKPTKPTQKKPSVKKPTKPTQKKPSVKKPSKTVKKSQKAGDIHQKADAARAKFLKRFDQNRDGKVTKDEAKAVLAAEAKVRAAARDKKKK